MTTPTPKGTVRRRAAIIGLGLDGPLQPQRIGRGADCLLIGGSEETHQALLETMLRLESELERLGVGLEELEPVELVEVAWRIDSPELIEVALRLDEGLRRRGCTIRDVPPAELTASAGGWDS